MSRYSLHGGRRVMDGIGRRPAGNAYRGRRFGYLHPVPSIRVWLIGPVWLGLTRDS